MPLKAVRSELFGEVLYLLDGQNVYFAGVSGPEYTSTINAAESVVAAICQAEKINWITRRFFDIQTHRGYQHRPGWYIVDELHFDVEAMRLRVNDWEPVAQAAWPREAAQFLPADASFSEEETRVFEEAGREEQRALPGIPEHVLAAFRQVIEA